MRGILLLGGCLLFLSVLACALHAQDVDTQKQLDVTLVRLERSLQIADRCQQEYAELYVQARRLTIAYQQLQQELAAAKPAPAPTSQEMPDAPPPSTVPRPQTPPSR